MTNQNRTKIYAVGDVRPDPAGFAGSVPAGLGALSPLKRLGVVPAAAGVVLVVVAFEVANKPLVVAPAFPAGCVPNKVPPVAGVEV